MENNPEDLALLENLKSLGIYQHDENAIIFKYTSVESAKKILENCSLRYSSPNSFNDPFEFHRSCLDISCSQEEMEFRLRRDIKLNKLSIDPEGFIRKGNLNDYIRTYVETLEEERKYSLVQCYSEANCKTLMWSHYADKHSGVCIGLKQRTFDPNNNFVITLKVNYTNEINPLRVLSTDARKTMEALVYWSFTKSAVWEYEKEIRTHISNLEQQIEIIDGMYAYMPLDPNQICSISFGAATPKKDIDEILAIIKAVGYKMEFITKMEIGPKTFDLVENSYG